MPETPDLTAIFNRSPEEIVNQFREKGYAISWNWRDVWQESHSRAFTVAKAVNQNVLEEIRGGVDQALDEGITFREFQKNLQPRLEEMGWWGRKEIVDPETGEITEVQLGSPHRLKTIYRTNLSTSYSAGRYKTQLAAAPRRPWWIYRTAGDTNVRDSHDALKNTVLRYDDPFWDAHYPPNDWGCRCGVDSLSDRQLENRGLTPASGENIQPFAGEGWNYNPGAAPWKPITPTSVDISSFLPALDGTFGNKRPIEEIPRTKLSEEDILPPLRDSGEPPEYYVQKFLDEFDTTIGKPIVHRDVVDDPLVISEDLFKDRKTGNWKLKRGRERYMIPIARAIKDPDEIWLAFMKKGEKHVLTRRYIKLFELEGEDEPAYVVFDLFEDEFVPTTGFVPDKDKINYVDRQRHGFKYYDKHE